LIQCHFPSWSLPDGLLALFENAVQSFSKFSGPPSDNLCLYHTDIIRELVWSSKLNLFSQKLNGERQTKAMQAFAASMSDGSLLFIGMRTETGTRLLKDECVDQLFTRSSKGEMAIRRANQAGTVGP
jgi:hypothetical protein